MDVVNIFMDAAFYGGLVVGGGLALKGTLFTVGQQKEGLVSRFGKYTGKPKKPGLHVKIPIVDRVDARVSTALTQIKSDLDILTKDDQGVVLPVSIQFEVIDTAKYNYKSNNPNTQIQDLVDAEVKKYTNEKTIKELYSDREEISAAVIKDVEKDIEDYGVQIKRVVISEPKLDAKTLAAYNDVKASERRKDAAKNDAEAERIMSVAQAQADKERNELMGQGIKSFRKSIAESYIETREALIKAGVNEDHADRFMEEAMRLDTLRDVGQQGNMVVMALENSGADASVMPQVMAAMETVNKRAQEQDNGKPVAPVQAPAPQTPSQG